MGAKLPESATRSFKRLEDITLSLLDTLKPPERLTVSQTAAKYRYLRNTGAYIGPWKNSTVPYMVEPMDMLTSPDHDGVVFVGPAQSAKTDGLVINWMLHSIKSDPMDLIIYNPTQAAARDFSMRRFDRLNRDSEAAGALLQKRRDADNKFDKHYTTGTMITLSHPSVTELAGKPIPRVALTDYDRMPDDVEGDGSPYDLASKRTTTFGSHAMTMAESSPSKPIEDLKWISRTPHEAPPAKGIFSLYNRGDRRRWYWPCPHCSEYFEGDWSLIRWDETQATTIDKAESVYMVCPRNGCVIMPDDRYEMNLWGMWLKDGEAIDRDGRRFGQAQRTLIASFWLRGVAAALTSWPKLVSSYLAAEQDFQLTGDEGSLRKFYNNDLAEPYVPKGADSERIPEHLKARAEEVEERQVPIGVRFLVATVDVQKNMFVVQIHGICPGSPYDVAVVDRFNIQKSARVDDDGDQIWVKPSSYLEDWDLLITEVMDKTYPLCDDSGRRMAVKFTVCDSGGYAKQKGEAVTTMAYEFYRKLRRENRHGRFHLVKGDSKPGQARVRITYPDAQTKDKFSAARGDVPVMLLNSNVLKDALSGRLDCVQPGKGMIRFPNWLPDWFFVEMCSERRTPKGWENPSHSRNEAWDLMYYCLGLCASKLLQVEKIEWDNPPTWAAEWDRNDMISLPGEGKRFAEERKSDYDFAQLARQLA